MPDGSSECAKGESGHRASPPQRIAVDSERDEPQRTQHQASLRSRRVAELERELEFTKSKLSCAIHELEIANEDRKSVNAKLAACGITPLSHVTAPHLCSVADITAVQNLLRASCPGACQWARLWS